jgi:hypothetical protein
MLLGRSLNTCHCHLFYLRYFIICITFICLLAKDRVLYSTHQNCMPTGPVVLHTVNFLGYRQGCGVLTVLYYKMVLKYTAHKRTYTAEGWRKYYNWWKIKYCQCTKLVSSAIYDGTLWKTTHGRFWSILTPNISKLLVVLPYITKSFVGFGLIANQITCILTAYVGAFALISVKMYQLLKKWTLTVHIMLEEMFICSFLPSCLL